MAAVIFRKIILSFSFPLFICVSPFFVVSLAELFFLLFLAFTPLVKTGDSKGATEREREREREREGERDAHTHKQKETDREIGRETNRDTKWKTKLVIERFSFIV